MLRLMFEHPEISTRLVIALGRRLREMNERLSRQSFQTVQSRVAVVLSELVAQELADGAEETNVLVKATQADLAQLAGSSRESASRFLAVLERAGVVSQGRGRLVVHEPEALKKYVFWASRRASRERRRTASSSQSARPRGSNDVARRRAVGRRSSLQGAWSCAETR